GGWPSGAAISTANSRITGSDAAPHDSTSMSRTRQQPDQVTAVVEYVAAYPPIADLIAKGQNKVSFHLRQGLQVDVRMLPEESFGAALQYFTGSKLHNVAVRQRAQAGRYAERVCAGPSGRWWPASKPVGRRNLCGAGDGLDSTGNQRRSGRD
ncbi:MAG: hypothetical protein ACYDC6_16365, partial [Acidobacteriaceae bacterium]